MERQCQISNCKMISSTLKPGASPHIKWVGEKYSLLSFKRLALIYLMACLLHLSWISVH